MRTEQPSGMTNNNRFTKMGSSILQSRLLESIVEEKKDPDKGRYFFFNKNRRQ